MSKVVSIVSAPEVVDVSSDEDDVVPLGPLWGPEVCAGAPPLRFRGYQRGRELGSGASGRVFVCSHQGQAGTFAVKTVDLRRLALRAGSGKERTKLSREVEILKVLPQHKTIVRMFDAFEEGKWFFMILELVEGGDLFGVLTARRPSRLLEGEAAHVLRQVSDGLGFLHEHSVIHRDVKLENVLIASAHRQQHEFLYEVKLTDFGLSKMVGTGRSAPHSFVGTRPYMAPEVEEGGAYDFSSDVWCLGVLLYVLVVGKFPFDRTPASQDDIDAVVQRPRRSLAARSVLSGMLQLEPAHRWTTDALCRFEWLRCGDEDLSPDRQPHKRPRKVT